MKSRMLTLLCAILISYGASGAVVPSELKGARVFLWGAEINRSAATQLTAGVSEVVFSGLPTDINPASVQVKVNNGITILSVTHRNNYLESPQKTQQVTMLTDSLEYYTREIASQQALLKVYEEEESMVLANKSLGGGEAAVKVLDLRAMADFFRQRLAEVKNLQLETKRKIESLQKRQNRVKSQLGQITSERNYVGEIVVNVSAPRAVRAAFDISYITNQASWSALYDLRAADTQKPVELVMKASIVQNTPEDWSNIQLTLSTANPLDKRVVPQLETWFLRFIQPTPVRLQSKRMEAPSSMLNEVIIVDDNIEIEMDEEMAFGSPAVIASQTNTTHEYQIVSPQVIKSGAGAQLVEVQRNELPANFTWYTVPRIDTDAFLISRISGWEEYVVLPGEASIFFENAFVGNTFIDPSQTEDTLEVSMGIDRGVVVERERLADFSKKSILGRRTTETVAWKITARNSKNRPINLEIRDQIPVSTNEDIVIELEEKSGADHTTADGMLKWRLELTPGQTAERIFRYTVRYPSDKIIRLE